MKISVVMTTYNGAQFLREQLDSIFAQSRLPDELIVCDDQSTDETPNILCDYAGRSAFPMQAIINDDRLGSTLNFEKAISLCSGDLIAMCDQDDVWRPQKLEVIESAFLADPGLGAVLTNADLIDKDGAPLRGDLWSRCRFDRECQRALSTSRRYDLLLGLAFATGATMAFRSSFKTLVLPFPTDTPTFIHDRWIAVLIAAVGRIAIIEEKLIAYRLHRQQQLGVGKLPLALRVFIPHACRSDAIALDALAQRLSCESQCSSSEFRHSLTERRLHIKARLNFSRNPIRRLKQVATEFRSGRYVRYPYGLIFSLKDLVVGTR